ncbi:retrovirus-related pol polyprotein from transposon TNT 1-94 [Tanacetum coccineum]
MFNAGNGSDESNQIVQRVPRTDSTPNKANVQCYNCNEKGHYARDCQKQKVHDAKYFREQMLLAMKDEAGSHLINEENDFMLDNAYGEELLDELTASVMLMAQLQPTDGTTDTVPSYDEKAVSQVHDSSTAHEQVSHVKRKSLIQTTDDDQIDSNIIFDDPYVANNGGTSTHDSIARDKIHEIQLLAYTVQPKKVFKERENQYLEDILDLEEKLSSHDQIVYKIGQSLQTIHMLGKKTNKIYDPFLKAGLGYQNHERLKKAIAAQPKMYDGDMLYSDKLKIHSPDSEETLEDAEESRNKMKDKIIQVNYDKINGLYETFFPQQELSAEQTYFSIPSTSNNSSESKDIPSESPVLKMPNESRLLKKIDKLGDALSGFYTNINKTLLKDAERRWLSDSQNELREFYKTDVIPMSRSLYMNLQNIKEELIEEVQEMLNIFESMEQRVNEKSPTETLLQKEIDRLLEVSLTSEIRDCVLLSAAKQTHDLLKDELEKSSNDSKEIQANLLHIIKILENDFQRSQAQSVESSHSVRRSTTKDIKSKNSILKNTKSSSTYVWKTLNNACLDSNKSDTKTSNVCQTNACISNSKTVKACVNVVNDGSNIVCISCGNDVFLNSHEKCVARHALSRKSSVKRALFSSPLAAQSKHLGATSVVTKSRLSVATTPTSISKISRVLTPSSDSRNTRTLSSYMNYKIATRRKWQKWFEYQHGFNWTPKSKSVQTPSSVTKSKTSVIQLVSWIVDSGCSKHMTGNLQLLRNFIEKFMGTVCFGNDHFAAITGYLDYVQGNLIICHVYYVKGLGHNLFSVGQFRDRDLEVAFRCNTCYVRNLEGDGLLTGSRDSNLYTISISEMAASSPMCLMSRATSTKSWLWHRRLSHLNFETINQLTSNDLVDGLPKFKYTKDHLCSACEQGKSKKASLPPKLVPSTESKLKLLHMDLCRPMRVASINDNKYILVIVDDYSRYTWVYFLRTKDEALYMIIDFINQVQRI